MKSNFFRKSVLGACAAIGLLGTVASCDADDIITALSSPMTCQQAADDLQSAIAAEGQLVDRINPDGDFSMALTLNATSLNKMFRAANDWSYSAFGIGIPTIAVGGCKRANLLRQYSGDMSRCLTFTIPLTLSSLGLSDVSATFGIPISAEIKGTEKSSIYVNLDEAQVIDLSYGSSSMIPIGTTLVEEAVHLLLDKYLTKKHMFDIQAWQMGDNQVKMLAGVPKVNEMEGTVTFGMYSNLLFAQTGSVDWAYEHTFPKDAELGLHIHPDLIRGLIARMMYENHIESGISQGANAFTVTMADMSKDYDEAYLLATDPEFFDYLTFAFRFWNTSGSMCGYMDVLAGLHLAISNSQFTISAGNVHAGKASGGMSLFAGLLSVITESNFFKDLMSYATLTVNFNEITVDDGKGGTKKAAMGSDSFEFSANGTGISLFMNFADL